jgi:hypothetical protein
MYTVRKSEEGGKLVVQEWLEDFIKYSFADFVNK